MNSMRERREALGLTLEELSQRVGVNRGHLSQIETGKLRTPKPELRRKLAKVPPITLHGLRHSVATLMMANGAHPKVVSDMLGHKDIKTTLNTYSHVSEEMHRVASDALTERLYGEKSG